MSFDAAREFCRHIDSVWYGNGGDKVTRLESKPITSHVFNDSTYPAPNRRKIANNIMRFDVREIWLYDGTILDAMSARSIPNDNRTHPVLCIVYNEIYPIFCDNTTGSPILTEETKCSKWNPVEVSSFPNGYDGCLTNEKVHLTARVTNQEGVCHCRQWRCAD